MSGVDELEDEATSTHTELESGNWVFDVAVETGSPLDVEVDDEAMETTAVDAVDVGEPRVDHLGSIGDEGLDMVGLESDFEEVMGVLVHFISNDCISNDCIGSDGSISSDCDFDPPLSLSTILFSLLWLYWVWVLKRGLLWFWFEI